MGQKYGRNCRTGFKKVWNKLRANGTPTSGVAAPAAAGAASGDDDDDAAVEDGPKTPEKAAPKANIKKTVAAKSDGVTKKGTAKSVKKAPATKKAPAAKRGRKPKKDVDEEEVAAENDEDMEDANSVNDGKFFNMSSFVMN